MLRTGTVMRIKSLFEARPTPHGPDRFHGVKELNARLALYGWLFSAAVMIGARGWGAIFSIEAFVMIVIGTAVAVHVFGYATFLLQRGSAIAIQTVVHAILGRKSAFCARFINGFGIGLFAANLAMVWT
ncbi:MAG: hypothetical protein AAGL49_15600, partial [Pseudomonadota bacterium]